MLPKSNDASQQHVAKTVLGEKLLEQLFSVRAVSDLLLIRDCGD